MDQPTSGTYTPINQKEVALGEQALVGVRHKKNIYPLVRHILLVACVLLTVSLIIFLIHQNGKSIYENGI